MLLFSASIFLALATLASSNCRGKQYSCIDCNRVQICHNTTRGFRETLSVSCPDFKQTPFCDEHTGSCSFVPSWGCAGKDAYPCIRDGVFPDPSDCYYYRECRNGVSRRMKCDMSGYTFDADKKGCYMNSGCYKIDCNLKNGMKVPHPRNAQFYAFCEGNKALFVDKCQGIYELDKETQKCGPACRVKGQKIPDYSDCTKYFLCVENTVAVQQTCLGGYAFDSGLGKCVRDGLVASCVFDDIIVVQAQPPS